jgi:transposase
MVGAIRLERRAASLRCTRAASSESATDIDGGISRVGDAMVRTALFEAAHIMLTPISTRRAPNRSAAVMLPRLMRLHNQGKQSLPIAA